MQNLIKRSLPKIDVMTTDYVFKHNNYFRAYNAQWRVQWGALGA